MKKFLVLTALMFVSACASGPIYRSNTQVDYTHYNCTGRRPCNAAPKQIVKQAPAPQPIMVYEAPRQVVTPCNAVANRQVQVAAQPCNSCAPSVKVVKEPVEIVYKKTTTTTVYEPRTTTDVTYEKEAIVTKTIVTTQTQEAAPVQVQVETPKVETISYTIDSATTENTAPVMPAEEIK